jgi:septal ring factor EnvC (AmiA/AmiB activator)
LKKSEKQLPKAKKHLKKWEKQLPKAKKHLKKAKKHLKKSEKQLPNTKKQLPNEEKQLLLKGAFIIPKKVFYNKEVRSLIHAFSKVISSCPTTFMSINF